jgi:hypothetical protein
MVMVRVATSRLDIGKTGLQKDIATYYKLTSAAGDGVLAEFGSAEDAVRISKRCSIAVDSLK